MEYALRDKAVRANSKDGVVLILVLMEYALREQQSQLIETAQ